MQECKPSLIRYRLDLLELPQETSPDRFCPAVRNSRFNILYPEEYHFAFLDISNSLAKICRYTGQGNEFLSVAEHSVRLSHIVPPEYAFEALMHDGTESVLGDVSAPLKSLLTTYKLIESWSDLALRKKYGLPEKMSDVVKTFDNDRGVEMNQIFSTDPKSDDSILCLDWRAAYKLFVNRGIELKTLGLVPDLAKNLIPDVSL